jgi:hypothetical protein
MKYYYIFILLIIIFTAVFFLSNSDLISYKYKKIISSSTAQIETNQSNYETIDYYARFNCGTIDNDKGPLRPGIYDSDITIFNKKTFPLTIIWKAIEINQENKSNFKIINIPPESIVNINCNKIYPSPVIEGSNLENRFSEGVVLIRINTNNGQLINNFFNNQDASVIINKEELGNLVNVDVLHTVNTLSNLKKDAFYFKVNFSLEQSDKKYKDGYKDNFTSIFKVEPNIIIDPIGLIKQVLKKNHSSNQYLSNNATIKIINSEMLYNSYTDNHALTFQKINPTITKG